MKDPFFTHCPNALGMTLKEVRAWSLHLKPPLQAHQ